MRENVAVYEPANGRIMWITQLPVPEEQTYLVLAPEEEPNSHDYYIVDGAITPRPEHSLSLDKAAITADGVDVATVSGLPVGTLARVNTDQWVTVDDGVFELTSDFPATFRIELMPPFPTKAARFEVTAS